ncbi:MAG: DUF2188 domain-containing protein [Chloroflexota bacterium]
MAGNHCGVHHPGASGRRDRRNEVSGDTLLQRPAVFRISARTTSPEVRRSAAGQPRRDSVNSNQRHVVHHPDGGWAVKKPHSQRASSRHSTQAEAQTRAKEILSHDGGGEAVTHGRDGSVRQSDTIDPAVVDWSLLSPQGHVLFYIGLCPDCTTKDIARAIGHSERQIRSMIRSLKDGGMLQLRVNRRRHHFKVNFDAPLLHPTIEDLSLRSVMEGAVKQLRSEDPNICAQVEA